MSNVIRNWWGMLSENERIEIYQNNNPEATDQDWCNWWYLMSDKEREEVFNENIQDTSNEGERGIIKK